MKREKIQIFAFALMMIGAAGADQLIGSVMAAAGAVMLYVTQRGERFE